MSIHYYNYWGNCTLTMYLYFKDSKTLKIVKKINVYYVQIKYNIICKIIYFLNALSILKYANLDYFDKKRSGFFSFHILKSAEYFEKKEYYENSIRNYAFTLHQTWHVLLLVCKLWNITNICIYFRFVIIYSFLSNRHTRLILPKLCWDHFKQQRQGKKVV
jgi:hypothetical protein